MQKRHRIALFSGNYNCVRDGANRALNRLVAHLLEQGAAVRVYSPVAAVPAFEPAGDLVPVPSFGIPGRSEYRIAPRLPSGLRNDVRAFAPTHFHLSAPDWLGTSAQRFARELGVPVVTSLHTRFETYLSYYKLGPLRGWMDRRLDRFYGSSDFILVPTQPIAEEFAAKGWSDMVAVWGRGVDRDTFSPARRDPAWRRTLGYTDSDVVPLFLGRLVLEKGIDLFADTIHLLRSRGIFVRPLIVGDGPARQRLGARLEDANFLGHLEDEELGRAVASADILINPSVTEAFGNVNLEAMASGLAIVSANAPSAAALIQSGRSGILVDQHLPGEYAGVVDRLIRSPSERARLAAEALTASRAYDWRRVFDPVMEAYARTQRG